MKTKKTFAFLFFIVAGVITGSLLSTLAVNTNFLSWLAYGQTIGIPITSPVLVDLALVQFSFALEMSINVAQIITVTIAMLLYRHIATKL